MHQVEAYGDHFHLGILNIRICWYEGSACFRGSGFHILIKAKRGNTVQWLRVQKLKPDYLGLNACSQLLTIVQS